MHTNAVKMAVATKRFITMILLVRTNLIGMGLSIVVFIF